MLFELNLWKILKSIMNFEAQGLPETENFPFTDEGVQGQIAGFGHMVPHKVHVSQKMFFKIQ